MNKTEKQLETLNTALERYKSKLAGARDEIAEANIYARDKIRAMKEQMGEVQMSSILGVIAGVGGTAIMNKLSMWLTEKWPVLKPFRKWTLGIASAILLYLANSDMVKDPAKKAMLFSAAGGMAGSLLIPFINKMIGAEDVATSGADEDSTSGVDAEAESVDGRYCDQAEDMLYGAAASGIEPGAVIAGVETGVIPPALIPLLIQAGQQFAPVAQDLALQLQRRLREGQPERRRAMRKTAAKARKVMQEPRVQQDIERLLLNALRALLPPAPAAPAAPTVAPTALMPALKDAGALIPSAPEAAGWRERVERRIDRREDRREARQDVLTPTAEAAPAVAPATAAADVLQPA